VLELRRTAAAAYDLECASTLSQLELLSEKGFGALDEKLLPLCSAVAGWPTVSLTADMLFYIRRGQAVQVSQAPLAGEVALYAGEGELIGIGRILDDGRVAPKRLLVL